jgi:hypothetical protein
VGPVVAVWLWVGIWGVGCTPVGEPGEVKGVCGADWVNAARVKATLVAMVPESGSVTPPCGMLQAARMITNNKKTARREKIDFIWINTPSFSIWMLMCFNFRRCSVYYRTILFGTLVFFFRLFGNSHTKGKKQGMVGDETHPTPSVCPITTVIFRN